jgi:spermidine/putrescine transport system permease protein
VAFGAVNSTLLTPIPIWNPLQWNVGWLGSALTRLEPGGDLWVVFVRTCEYVGISLALCLLIGYPVAYYIARHTSRTKSLLLILLILPLWISYLMRMLAWVNLLAPDGYVNRFLMYTHVITSPYGFLDGRPATVILALVYGYIPYLILPLYASLDRIDKSFMEAARDLGASPWRTFLHVTLPLSKTGILGGSVLVALPMFGDYYTPNIVSGAPTTSMLGNQIDLYFHNTSQPTIGAALTLLLSGFLVILMGYYMVTVARATRELRG